MISFVESLPTDFKRVSEVIRKKRKNELNQPPETIIDGFGKCELFETKLRIKILLIPFERV